MYWSEWGSSRSIKKAAMDGSNIEKLVATKGFATHLTLDYDNRRLYWLEVNVRGIRSVDLNGNDFKIIVDKNIYQPVGLSLFKNYIYWSDNYTGEIVRANKFDGSDRQIIYKNCYNVTDLQVHHSHREGSNQCANSNGGCNDLCLALPGDLPEKSTKFTCACPTHYTLVNKKCDREFLTLLSIFE